MGREEENKFGLVYDGALTENIPGKVNINAVKYDLRCLTIAANVYTPADFDASKKYAAVVVAHPNDGVKEQVPVLPIRYHPTLTCLLLMPESAWR